MGSTTRVSARYESTEEILRASHFAAFYVGRVLEQAVDRSAVLN